MIWAGFPQQPAGQKAQILASHVGTCSCQYRVQISRTDDSNAVDLTAENGRADSKARCKEFGDFGTLGRLVSLETLYLKTEVLFVRLFTLYVFVDCKQNERQETFVHDCQQKKFIVK
ncbi:uncharacterized protein PGTG_18984 [Puccinia graminis f. sp. tritici CRL 75-36-700-3]|uniref:Uncharacterized protein n=1 Tax=Puccinia graminis f. sp. tritici (strain CRL 75-36-700-3 / race SCCL) TaxID=418459 RepID=E3L8U6_PUCGT|nr:uncharacterized protein PGTG_18984 [Puccinia graminis f. sp. tritici CRL 75-36-700-3]EFP92971.2 hypothetical protein PGTG_18984 [Puccinia graminis f. sp. tritici CRL 75-36-700-3]